MSTEDTVVFFVAKAAVVAQVGGDHIAAHPLSAGWAVIFLVAEGAVVAEMGWDPSASHPIATGNAVVLLVAKAAVVAEVSPCPRHILLWKNYINGWIKLELMRSLKHLVAARDTDVFLAARSALFAQPRRIRNTIKLFPARNAMILFVSLAAVVAKIG